MGAGASTHDTLSAVETQYNEISALVRNGDHDTAVFLAVAACENLPTVEEKLHEVVAYGDVEYVKRTVDYMVFVAKAIGENATEYLESMNVGAAVLLCMGQLEMAEEYINYAFHLAQGDHSMGYARVLMNYYSLRRLQENEHDAGWGKDSFLQLIQENNSRKDRFSTKKLRYRLQNLAVIHRENAYEPGANVFAQQEHELLGPEEDHDGMTCSISAPNLHTPSSVPHTTRGGNQPTFSFDDDDLVHSNNAALTPMSVYSQPTHVFTPMGTGRNESRVFRFDTPTNEFTNAQHFFADERGNSFDDNMTQYSSATDKQHQDEVQQLLFELCSTEYEYEEDEIASRDGILSTMRTLNDGQIIDLLTRSNDQGDTLLLAGCRAKNGFIVQGILDFAKKIRRNLDLSPQLLGAKNAIGLTPLHVSCHSNYHSYQVTEILLDAGGASICFQKDRSGCTPLHYAAASGSSQIIALLLLHGASTQAQDRQGFLPVDYCDPTNVECFNLLYTPLEESKAPEPQEEEEEKLDPNACWEKRLDGGSKNFYFYNTITGEVLFPNEEANSGTDARKSDEQLLAHFTNLSWRIGLQQMLKKRKAQARNFAISQAKAKLCLLEQGDATKNALRFQLETKDKTLSQLRQELLDLAKGKSITEDRLDEMLCKLADERAVRMQEQEEHRDVKKKLEYTETMVATFMKKLQEEQKNREELTKQLMSVRDEILQIQAVANEGKDLTEAQRLRLEELNQMKTSLEEQLVECSDEIAYLTQELKQARDSNEMAKETIDKLQETLNREAKLRKEALERAKKLEEESFQIQQMNRRLAMEKDAMEEKLARERQQLEEEGRLRKLQEAKLLSAESNIGSLQTALDAEQRERQMALDELQRIQDKIKNLNKERLNDAQFLAEREREAMAKIKASEEDSLELKRQLEAAENAKSQAAGELEALQKRLEQEKKYREKAKNALDGMSKKLLSANEELALLMRHLENEQKQRERAANELMKVQSEMKHLKQSHASNLNQTEEQARQVAREAAELAKREEFLSSELQKYEDDIGKLNKDLMLANVRTAQAAEELEDLQKRLEQEREARLNLNSQLGNANAKLKQMEDERRLEAVKWNMERSQNQREKLVLEQEYKKLLAQLEEEQKNRDKHEQHLRKLQQDISLKDEKLKSEQNRIAAISKARVEANMETTNELAQLRAQLEEERRAREARDKELEELRKKDADRLEKEKEHLLERLRQEQNWRQQAVDELAQQQEKLNEERQAHRAKMEAERAALEAKLKAEAEEKRLHQQELDRIKTDMSDLRHRHDKVSEQSAEEAAQAAELQRRERELQDKMRAMEEHMARLEKEKGALYDEFVEEQALRKQYFNEIEDLKGRIRVFCRVRPMSQSEKEKNCTSVIKVLDDVHVLLQHPEVEGRRKKEDQQFAFDVCFGPEKSQENIFSDSKRLVQLTIDGYNVCIFAYGQTGSGKTYTLLGPDSDDAEGELHDQAGIATRAIHELFRLMDRDSARFTFEPSIYVIELYKETLIDLLYDGKEDTAPPLDVHLDANGVVDVENITKKTVRSVEETVKVLRQSFNKRKVTETKMNSHSSRSHLICSILIKATAKATGAVTKGKLTLVDLAGSERASKTGATGETLKEAQAINKSLLALGDVIQALTTDAKHVPYRNHPLTQLMADSIGGNAKTLMFVNINPADYNLQETKESLRWASRVKQVTNTSSKIQVQSLRQQLEKLKKAQKVTSAVSKENKDMTTLAPPKLKRPSPAMTKK